MTLCLERPNSTDKSQTAFLSEAGHAAAIPVLITGDVFDECITSESLEEQLSEALEEARTAVLNQFRYLGPQNVAAFHRGLNALFDVEAWDEEDAVPDVLSVATLIRVTIALGLGVPQLTATDSALAGTWYVHENVLRVVGRSDGRVDWSILYPVGSSPRHDGQTGVPVREFLEQVESALGGWRGNSRGQ